MPTLDVDGATLEYDRRGSGRPLVLLHGAWVDRHQWAPQMDRFADEYEVVAPDLRGHGESTTGGRFDLDRMADDVTALWDALDLAAPVVCGLSMGGLVAQQVALDRPDRVAGLVLAGTVRSVPPVPMPEAARSAMFPAAPAKLLARTMGPAAYFRMLLAGVESAGRWLALSDDARQYALDCVDRQSVGPFTRVIDAFSADSARDLSGLSVPALLLDGDHELPPVTAQTRRMAAALPDAETGVVPDAGHLANRDNPAAFDDALRTFLEGRVAA